MSISELQAEREKRNIPRDGNVNGRPITDRATEYDPDPYEEDAESLFPQGFFEGDEKTIKNLIKAGSPVEVTVSLMSAEVPSRTSGLLDPDNESQVLVTYEVSKYHVVPKREGETGDKSLAGWKIRQQIRPTYVQRGQFYTREQVIEILAELGVENNAKVEDLLG